MLRPEIEKAGDLTDELRQKAKDLGIPDNIMEMLAGNGPGRIMPGNALQKEGGGNRSNNGNRQSTSSLDMNTVIKSLAPSAVLILAGIIMAWFFRRRRYVKV